MDVSDDLLWQMGLGQRAGYRMLERYKRTKVRAVADRALTLIRQCADTAQPGEFEWESALRGILFTLAQVYEQDRDVAALRGTAEVLRELVEKTQASQSRAGYLSALGNVLRATFDHVGDRAALSEAVAVSRRAVTIVDGNDPQRFQLMAFLASALSVLAETTNDRVRLDESVHWYRTAANGMTADDPSRAGVLSKLGGTLRVLAEYTASAADRAEAIEFCRQAVGLSSPSDPEWAKYLGNLGIALAADFGRSHARKVIDEAVDVLREALDHSPDADRAGHLDDLATALWQSSKWTGDAARLQEAVDVARTAVAVTPSHDVARDRRLSHLGAVLLTEYERNGRLSTLEEAVRVSREAAPGRDPRGRALRLHNLGQVLDALWHRSGDARIATERVDTVREAVALGASDHRRLMYVSSLGYALANQFEVTGDLVLLNEAVLQARSAVLSAVDSDPLMPNYLQNLGIGLLRVFERTGDRSALDELVDTSRRQCRIAERDNPVRALGLSNLSIAQRSRCDLDDDDAALAEATTAARESVKLTAVGTVYHDVCQQNLANCLRLSYERTGDPELLWEAIAILRAGAAASPLDRPTFATNLGAALRTAYEREGDSALLQEAIDSFATVADGASEPVHERARAAALAANLAIHLGDPRRALVLAEQAVELLPLVVAPQLRRGDREHRVTGMFGLAATAANAAIGAGDPERAVELLEQARGVLIGEQFDMRTDLAALAARAPDLADEMTRMRQESAALDRDPLAGRTDVDVSTAQLDAGIARAYHDMARRREDLDTRLADLLARIRALPDFEGFLRPPTVDSLRRQAADGPIVFLVATESSDGHAIVLRGDKARPVSVIPLPGLTHEFAVTLAAELTALVDAEMGEPNGSSGMADLLATLWQVITEPVLRDLGLVGPPRPGHTWPRIWWCPVGPLAALPLHAAGHHDDSDRTVLDRVISSYTPTIRALAAARTRGDAVGGPSALVVSVPEAPGAPALPGVTGEVGEISRLMSGVTVLSSSTTEATYDTVTAALSRHRIAHFACHSLADLTTPALSRLLLDDHHDRPLTVSDVGRLDLPHAELAYLSACSTTKTADRHADEATHITAAFHVAGYRSVIGTLWPVKDRIAATVARDFYTHLTANGTQPPVGVQAAAALHEATRRCRQRYPRHPTQWAAHVHTGM